MERVHRDAFGRPEVALSGAGGERPVVAQARLGVEVGVAHVVYCSTTRRCCAGQALRAACACAACCLFVVGRKLCAGWAADAAL